MSKIVLNIPYVTGLDQSRGEASGQMTGAWDCANMDTRGGELKTAAGWAAAFPAIPGSPVITTLAPFHRRNHATQKDVVVAASADSIWVYTDAWQCVGTGYQSGHWDWVTYEDASGEDPVDILLLSNAQDGMMALRGDSLALTAIPTPGKFAVLARYKERIFGAGDPEYPDRIYYSQPFDPSAWGQVTAGGVVMAEQSGGCIDAPTWDGDAFIALRPFGSSLLAFKSATVFRIYGADPGEFYLRDQFGTDGPITEDTVAVYADSAFLLSRAGISLYDGSLVSPYRREDIRHFWEGLNGEALGRARGAVAGHCYYLALTQGSGGPDRLLALDLQRGHFMVYEGLQPTVLMAWKEQLYFADGTQPGVICRLGIGETANGQALVCRWVSPYCTLDRPGTVKSDFRISGLIRSSGTGEKMKITLESERGTVSRTVSGKSGANLRSFDLRLPHYARRFRLRIENVSGSSFALVGALRMECRVQEGGLA